MINVADHVRRRKQGSQVGKEGRVQIIKGKAGKELFLLMAAENAGQ
jgi:hypothetical protein